MNVLVAKTIITLNERPVKTSVFGRLIGNCAENCGFCSIIADVEEESEIGGNVDCPNLAG